MALAQAFRDAIAHALPADAVITEPEQLHTYECDALTGHRAQPELVVLAGSADDVQAVVRLCAEHGVPFVARGAGTGLSGGALPVADGIVISLARLDYDDAIKPAMDYLKERTKFITVDGTPAPDVIAESIMMALAMA